MEEEADVVEEEEEEEEERTDFQKNEGGLQSVETMEFPFWIMG